MKVLIVAGGTGGHFYPGLAVAQQCLLNRDEVHFIVKKEDKVIDFLKREHFPYHCVSARGFLRSITPRTFIGLWDNVRGLFESLEILSFIKPDVVLAMGGYLSIPVGIAARLKKIPLLLHEQNVMPGLANRMLSWLAHCTAISFSESKTYFKGSVVITGNPVRAEFFNLPDRVQASHNFHLDPSKKTLLVFGGSLGAHRINALVVEALAQLENIKNEWQVLHFTGEKDKNEIDLGYDKLGFPHTVDAYCHQMPQAYAVADAVICRAGASTISELTAVKKPALLIPYPYATNNHQMMNARVLVEWGAALMIEESTLSGESMASALRRFLAPLILDQLTQAMNKAPVDFSSSAIKIRKLLLSLKSNF